MINAPFYEGTRGEHDPALIDLIRELRETLGMFSGAMSRSPSDVWAETLNEVQALMRAAGVACIVGDRRCHCRTDLPTYHYTTTAVDGERP
jgi:hypothetical protein